MKQKYRKKQNQFRVKGKGTLSIERNYHVDVNWFIENDRKYSQEKTITKTENNEEEGKNEMELVNNERDNKKNVEKK